MNCKIGKTTIGPGHPTFIVAEISGNHGGSIQKALKIIGAAKKAGADAIKLQTYRADTITLNSNNPDFRLSDGPWSEHTTLWNLYSAAHTPWEWHEELFAEATKHGLEIFSSPFDETAVALLEKLGVVAYKIASPEVTHIPLLKCVAQTGKPVILSTGVADSLDLELALDTLRNAGAKEIMILKCTTAYPAPIDEINLKTIPDIMERYNLIAGLSDHSIGTASAVAAVAIGASIIEKHFTLGDSEKTVDSFFSSDESEFTRLVQDIREVEKALGSVSYEITPSAMENIRARRSLYVSADIKEGEELTPLNVKVVRPSFGMHPKHYSEVIGRHAKFALEKGSRLNWDMITNLK